MEKAEGGQAERLEETQDRAQQEQAHQKAGALTAILNVIDAKTAENGLVVSTSGPPIDIRQGYLKVRPFDHTYKIWYGEKRELPLHLQHLADEFGESVMVISFPDLRNGSLYTSPSSALHGPKITLLATSLACFILLVSEKIRSRRITL